MSLFVKQKLPLRERLGYFSDAFKTFNISAFKKWSLKTKLKMFYALMKVALTGYRWKFDI